MITFAQREEEAHPLGIAYIVGEVETIDRLGAFDPVTAVYLLVHATSRDQLAAMCQAVVKQLQPGGGSWRTPSILSWCPASCRVSSTTAPA